MTLAGMAALPVGVGAFLTSCKILADPHHVLTYSEHRTTAIDAAWSPDGALVASAGWLAAGTVKTDGGTVKIWSAATGKTMHTCIADHPGPAMDPLDVMWSADGRYVLAFVGWDHGRALTDGSRIVEMVQVWDAATGQRVRSIPVTEPVIVTELGDEERSLTRTWALNERYVAAVNGQDLGTAHIWEIATGAKIATLRADRQRPPSRVQHIVWAPDNETLAIGWIAQDVTKVGPDPAVDIWNIATRSEIATLRPQSRYYLGPDYLAQAQASWAPDSRTLALMLEDHTATGQTRSVTEIWDALASKKTQTIQPTAEYLPRAWSPNGRYYLIGNELYDVETGARVIEYTLQGQVGRLAWSPEGARVALVDVVYNGHTMMGSQTSTLSVVDALSGRRLAKYETGGRLAWSPDGKRVMVVGLNIDIWKVD